MAKRTFDGATEVIDHITRGKCSIINQSQDMQRKTSGAFEQDFNSWHGYHQKLKKKYLIALSFRTAWAKALDGSD